MGTYTTPYMLYKPVGGEFVDVETQLNRNLDILDAEFKLTFDYQGTDTTSITDDASLSKEVHAKYYKTHSNASVIVNTSGTVTMDTKAWVPEFEDFSFASGWNTVPTITAPMAFQKTLDSAGTVKRVNLKGNCRLNAYDAIVQGTTYTIGVVPSGLRPAVSKVYVSNCDTALSIANISILSNGNVNVVRFGNAQSAGAASNIVSFAGIEWAI